MPRAQVQISCHYNSTITRSVNKQSFSFFRQTQAYPVPAPHKLRRRMKLLLPRSPDSHSPPQREERNVNGDSHFYREEVRRDVSGSRLGG
jgi:hypothetical protein